MMLDPLFTFSARSFLGLLFLATGLHKARRAHRFRTTIAAYRILPTSVEKYVTWPLVCAELIIGAGLLTPSVGRWASAVAAVVFAAYFLLMASSIARGHRDVDCGCALHNGKSVVSGALLGRNLWLVMLGIGGLIADSGRALGWLDRFQIVTAVISLALIYLTADSLLARGESDNTVKQGAQI